MIESPDGQAARLGKLDQPVDIAWLAAFRILFGVTMCASMLRFIVYGWIDGFFVMPGFHFKYWGFEWVKVPGALGMHVLFWVLAALAAAVALGLFFRVTALAFALGFAYLQLLDVSTYLNHYYLAVLLAFLLALSPAHRSWSLDARRRGARVGRVRTAWLMLFRVQVGVVYTFAGLAKAQSDWLLHAQPLQIWLASRTDLPVLGPLFAQPWAPPFMSWAGFLFDTTIVWWLLWRRTRPFAYAIVIGFHLVTRMLFPIGMFPVIMVTSALVFFSPSWPRALLAAGSRVVARLGRGRAAESRVAPADIAAGCSPRWRAPAIAAAALYALVQVVWPMRFLAYGNDVLWHEQGMRFSWRVMVREKNGSVTFRVRDPATSRTWEVSPGAYLTRIQEREMSGQPDLVLQLAHHVRDDFRRRGYAGVEVRADALVSLNGRPAVPMIDPTVDLAAVDDGLARAAWIAPAPRQAPPRLRPLDGPFAGVAAHRPN